MQLAPEFDPQVYRQLHADLTSLDHPALKAHYDKFGRREGRAANALVDRYAFVGQIPPESEVLEVGPFANPFLVRPTVRYCDVQGHTQLRERAKQIGLDPAKVPTIHYVLDDSGLEAITDQFDALISSHSVEHQPDLVEHLLQVERRLRPGGAYFLAVPDKRYCFDRYIAPSTIAEVMEAHEHRRKTHTLRSVIEHRALTTHNEAEQHWRNAEPDASSAPQPVAPHLVQGAINEWRAANGGYVDVHAWYFTPDSFSQIIGLLNELGQTRLRVQRVYPTRRGNNEFWAVLS